MAPLRCHFTERIGTRRQYIFFFIRISWNSWLGTTLDNPLRYWIWIYYYLLNGIGVDLDLESLPGYEKYLTLLLNSINIWFITPRNI